MYHNVHKNGKLYFDPNLRKCVKNSEYKITGWKYNRRFQYRWTYNNMEYSAEEEIITGLFNKFWEMVNAVRVCLMFSRLVMALCIRMTRAC